MKLYLKSLILLVLGFGLAARAHAAPCDGSTPCQAPVPGSVGTPTITTIPATAKNSGGTANVTGSLYFFEATTAGASNVADPTNGTVVFVSVAYLGSGVATDSIGANITPVVGGQFYNIFVKACPSGTLVTDSDCSSWVSLGSATTVAYPSNPGFPDIAKVDTSTRSFTARTASVQDANNVLDWQLKVNNDDADLSAGSSSLLTQQPFSGNPSGAGAFLINTALYSGLLPNVGYTATENLIYFYNKTGPTHTTGQFFTQPVDPIAINPVINITHCSATFGFQNAANSPANPSDSSYLVAPGGGVTAQSKAIGGTGIFTDTNSIIFTDLTAGATYNATVIVKNRGGASWRDSNTDSYNQFFTVSWGGQFSITGVSTSSATFNVLSLNTVGISSYQIVLNGAPQGSPIAGVPPSTIGITGLTPNTEYTAQIKLFETSGCFSVLPITPIGFTTTAADPVAVSFTAPSPRSLHATWTDSLNPNGSTYEFQFCTGVGFTGTCQTSLPTKAANGTQALTVTDGVAGITINPETDYYARVRTRNIDRPTWADSNWVSFTNPVTTPNETPSLSVTVQVWTTSATLVAVSTDAAGGSNLAFTWSATLGTLVGSPAGTSVNSGITATNTIQVLLGTGLAANGSVTVEDHGGVGGLSNTKPWSTSAVHIASSISISPSSATVQTGKTQVFNAIVLDQGGVLIPNCPVVWSVNGGGGIAPTPSSFTVFSAATPSGGTPWVLTASSSPAPAAHANITVIAAGPFFTQTPPVQITLNPDNVTAAGSTLGTDNVTGTTGLIYTWSVVSGPGVVAFSPNGTGLAHDTTLTFNTAGTYVIQVTLSNANGTVSASTSTFVPQVLTGNLTVTPPNVTLPTLGSQQFTATGLDQFSKVYTLPTSGAGAVTWGASSGNVAASGAFSAPSTLGTVVTITATSVINSITHTGHATATLVSYDVSGAHAFPVPYKASMGLANGICFTGIGTAATIKIYTPSGHKVFDQAVNPQNPGAVPSATVCDGFSWNLKNSSGEKVASGVYFFEVESPGGKKDGKLIIIQ